ncbi:hypothetical protein GBA52_005852 [Prunus armeniaca]|nr:hypothetical protein GBA52_005852 [Prunus armeniaca]
MLPPTGGGRMSTRTSSTSTSGSQSKGYKTEEEQMAELREIFRSFDGNKDDSLTQPDLNLVQPQACSYRQDQLRNMFRLFDRDGNGYISPAELAHSMAKLGHPLTAEELIGMMDEADTDRDGRIDFDEFSRAVNSAAFLNK